MVSIFASPGGTMPVGNVAGDFLARIHLNDANTRFPGHVFVSGVPQNRPYRYTLQPLTGTSPYQFNLNSAVIVPDTAKEADDAAAKVAKQAQKDASRQAVIDLAGAQADIAALSGSWTPAEHNTVRDVILNILIRLDLGA